jgi:hypothetical protein
MNLLVKNIVRFLFLVLFQVYVLDKVLLHQMVTPYLYFIFILWLPFSIGRSWLMVIGFVLGYSIDSFRQNPGFHAAACVLVAYLRPFVANLLLPTDGAGANYNEPSVKSFGGFLPYFTYAALLATAHNCWLFLLEAWQFADPLYFLIKTVLSTLVTLFWMFAVELIFYRKQKYKTNTA